MLELNDRIAQIELRAEQLVLHLRVIDTASAEAKAARADLLAMLHCLRSLKEKRQSLEDACQLEAAA
jgi:hypothetical protein